MNRLDWVPLERFVAASGGRRYTGPGVNIPSIDADAVASVPWLASVLGVSGRRVHAYRADGTVPLVVAERLCDHLRVHPAEVWGYDYHVACPDCVEDERTRRYRIRRDAARLAGMRAS